MVNYVFGFNQSEMRKYFDNNNNYCKAVSHMVWELPISEINWLKLILKAIYCRRFSHLDWHLARLHFAVKKMQNKTQIIDYFHLTIFIYYVCAKKPGEKNKIKRTSEHWPFASNVIQPRSQGLSSYLLSRPRR